MSYGSIPQELKNISQWVCRKGKTPINPHNCCFAKCDDPKTWGSFEQAINCVKNNMFDGIGFEFSKESGLTGIDIDHCINTDTGEINDLAASIISDFKTYKEISPSGSGLHIIAAGKLPGKGHKWSDIGVEMYDRGRYFTITGNSYGDSANIINEQDAINKWYGKLVKQHEKPAFTPTGGVESECSLEEREIIKIATRAKNGALFSDLYRGNWQAHYNSQSEADIALCNILAFYTSGNGPLMDKLFRASGLIRPKWDEKRGAETYGDITLNKAINGCTEVYKKRSNAIEDFIGLMEQATPIDFINPLSNMKRYSLDDLGAARLFSDTFKDRVTYLPEYKSYWVYTGGSWKQDSESMKVRQFAKQLSDYIRFIIPAVPAEDKDDPYKAIRKHYNKYREWKYLKTLIVNAQDELSGKTVDFDKQPLLFNVKNGTLNLETMKLQPHKAEDKLSKIANVSYVESARCDRFEQFITEITEGNIERANMLQKALGYCLKGEANEECYFTAIGEKTRNGKGTLFDTVLNIFGSYGKQMDFYTIARSKEKDGSRATPDLARLIGVRLVLSNEPQKGICIDEALLKQLTGGDQIPARPLYGSIIEFKPVFRLFITANSKPTVSDDSLFASDRIKLLPFTKHFDEGHRDTGLKSKFRTEEAKSGILNWLLEGYKKYCTEGLKDTQEMKEKTEQYRRDNDYIGQYLDERFNFEAKGTTTVKALRSDYSEWCQVVGTKPLGLKLFKEELEKRDISIRGMHNHQDGIDGQIVPNFNYEGSPQ